MASGSGQGALSTLLCRSRHFGCSCILSLQKLYTAPTLLRCSFSDILLWKLKSARERDSALQEVLGDWAIRLRASFLERSFGNFLRRADGQVEFEIVTPASESYLSLDAEERPWEA